MQRKCHEGLFFRTCKATVTVTGGPVVHASIAMPQARNGFVGAAAGAQRFAQCAPTHATAANPLNQPIGEAKADEIAMALGLDSSKCFTPQQRDLFISEGGVGGDPSQAALVDEIVNLLTNSIANPLNSDINGTPTQIVLRSYGLAVSKDGVWLDTLANSAGPRGG
ncbi:MAG: hypothetical protein EBR23_03715 [Planctomycetia bacterium]|nr:hypothetical protein [Planctomycetia bacterium]